MSVFAYLALTELDSRSADGLEVSLLWNPDSGTVFIAVFDAKHDSESIMEIPADKARDAFNHPYAYLYAKQGNSYPVAA